MQSNAIARGTNAKPQAPVANAPLTPPELTGLEYALDAWSAGSHVKAAMACQILKKAVDGAVSARIDWSHDDLPQLAGVPFLLTTTGSARAAAGPSAHQLAVKERIEPLYAACKKAHGKPEELDLITRCLELHESLIDEASLMNDKMASLAARSCKLLVRQLGVQSDGNPRLDTRFSDGTWYMSARSYSGGRVRLHEPGYAKLLIATSRLQKYAGGAARVQWRGTLDSFNQASAKRTAERLSDAEVISLLELDLFAPPSAAVTPANPREVLDLCLAPRYQQLMRQKSEELSRSLKIHFPVPDVISQITGQCLDDAAPKSSASDADLASYAVRMAALLDDEQRGAATSPAQLIQRAETAAKAYDAYLLAAAQKNSALKVDADDLQKFCLHVDGIRQKLLPGRMFIDPAAEAAYQRVVAWRTS